MVAFLRYKGQILWDVTVKTAYVLPLNFLALGSRDKFDANNKAVDYLYRSLRESEFERVRTKDLAFRIWEQLMNAHAGNTQVQAWLFATYQREYENFTHLLGKSIDAMFQRFTVIVNNMRANVAVLLYDDHDSDVKLLHSLDRTVWSGKVEDILELEKYETLKVDELFSKLKSSGVHRVVRAKIENPTDPHSLALVSGSRTNANMSSRLFSLSCLVFMPDEEFDVLGEEDLTLLSRRFERMYTNRKNARRSSGMCYPCGEHMQFIAECPEDMEVKHEYKHHLRTDHKHRRGTPTRVRTSPSGGRGRVVVTRRRSERWWPVRATSTQAPATLHRAQLMKKRTGTRASSRARTSTACASPPKAFAAWHIAPQARRETSITRAPTPR
jgi:hypothetical protein